MVRILKFDFEEIERDFRMVFKNNNIRFYRSVEEDRYNCEFPGNNLNMVTEPYWLSHGEKRPVTKLTLYKMTEKNEAFAEKVAESIDAMSRYARKEITDLMGLHF